MATKICGLYINPPIAIARLGGSSAPLEAYQWIASPDPRANGGTAVAADWSLRVRADATVEPYRPTEIQFRDGDLIRPVCPFFEVHALVGDPKTSPDTWTSAPLTAALLESDGLRPHDVRLTIDAQNHKAFRRTKKAELRFGTFPPVVVAANNYDPVPLSAVSPPDAAVPMIPAGRSIPLGSIQCLRGIAQPPESGATWAVGPNAVRVDVLRFRFTPAKGYSYGPPQAARALETPAPRSKIPPVDPSRAFLDPAARWWKAKVNTLIAPQDTYDGAHTGRKTSFGVVDDTCEVAVTVALRDGARALSARCNIFVGPPDFAPDHRPFLSLADELNDRVGDDAVRNAAMSPVDRDAWVQDLFARIYETLSLMNVDVWRAAFAVPLTTEQMARRKIVGDAMPSPRNALGGYDKLRDPLVAIARSNSTKPLPITERARDRHRALMDLDELRNTIARDPGLIRRLIRAPFEVDLVEARRGDTTMRMPPFMRNSNAFPLTLSGWQHDLLMNWVAGIEAGGDTVPSASESAFAVRADTRQQAVLTRTRARPRARARKP